ncbi:MAG: hypothetical protein PHH75_00065 [Candidatus Omnitrophica bacterium]|nr:hypothetical protein [Candidatus Omnitrophota bacterium]
MKKLFSFLPSDRAGWAHAARYGAAKAAYVLLGIVFSWILLEAGLRLAAFGLQAFGEARKKNPAVSAERPGAVRILCLGNCYTTGVGVDPQDAYPSLLRRILERAYPGNSFVVFNGGMRGKNLSHFVYHLDTIVRRYRPDIIIFNVNERVEKHDKNLLLSAREYLSPWGRLKLHFERVIHASKVYQIAEIFADAVRGKPMETLPQEIFAVRSLADEMDGIYATRIRHFNRKFSEGAPAVGDLVEFARVLADQGLYGPAAQYMEEAVKRDPGRGEYYADLFWYEISLGRYPQALETQKRMMAADPGFISGVRNTIEKLVRTQDDGAFALQRPLALSDKHALAGDYEQAAAVIQACFSLTPEWLDHLIRLDFYEAVLAAQKDKTLLCARTAGAPIPRRAEIFYREKAKPWNFIERIKKSLKAKGAAQDVMLPDGYLIFGAQMKYNLERIAEVSKKYKFVFLVENMATFFDQVLIIEDACRQLQIPMINVYEAFNKASDQDALFHPDLYLRLSEKGNEVWAEAVHQGLRDEGLLAAAGVAAPPAEGKRAPAAEDRFFSRLAPREWVVLTPGWKMFSESQGCRLYRYREDLFQEDDVALQHPEVVYQLTQALQVWRREVVREDPDNTVILSEEAKERLRQEGYW